MLAPRRPVQRELPNGRAEPAAQNEAQIAGSALQIAADQLGRDRADYTANVPPMLAQAAAASDALVAATESVTQRATRWAGAEGHAAMRRFRADWAGYGLGLAQGAGEIIVETVVDNPVVDIITFIIDGVRGYYACSEQDAQVADAQDSVAYATERAAVTQVESIRALMLASNSWMYAVGGMAGRFEAMFEAGGSYDTAIADLRREIREAGASPSGNDLREDTPEEHQQAGELSASYARTKSELGRMIAGMRGVIPAVRAQADARLALMMTRYLTHKTDNRIALSGYVQPNATTFQLHVSPNNELSGQMRAYLLSLSLSDLRRENVSAEVELTNMATTPHSQVTLTQLDTGGRRVTGDVDGLGALVHWMRSDGPVDPPAARRQHSGIAQQMLWTMLDGAPIGAQR